MLNISIPVAMLCASVLAQQAPSYGKIVVSHDEWTLSNTGFTSAAGTTTFVQNVCAWFTGGRQGSFLAYSSDPLAFAQSSVATAIRAANHTWTVSTSVTFDLPTLLSFDGVFLGGPPALNTQVLTQYVRAGGHVYLTGGAAWPGDAPAQAAAWNPFLNEFGLGFNSYYNSLCGALPIASMHPVFRSVAALYGCIGQGIVDLAPGDPRSQVLASSAAEGLYAVFEAHGAAYDSLAFPNRGRLDLLGPLSVGTGPTVIQATDGPASSPFVIAFGPDASFELPMTLIAPGNAGSLVVDVLRGVLLTDPAYQFDSAGRALPTLAVPRAPNLIGSLLRMQWVALQTSPTSIVLSHGVRTSITP